jgi:TRAP-type C4-dicarboxylate transport system permease small subunit
MENNMDGKKPAGLDERVGHTPGNGPADNKGPLAVLEKAVGGFNMLLAVLAGISLMCVIFLVVGNAVLREFTDPFAGTKELAGWLTAITAAFALGYAQMQKSHVDIDLLVKKFPPLVRNFVHFLMILISFVFFVFVGFGMIQYGFSMMESNTLSETMRVALYPYVFLTAIGFIGLCLALLVDMIKLLAGVKHGS